MIDEACGILGRTATLVKSDEDLSALDFPVADIEDDEQDVVATAPRPHGPVVAVPELTHPGESASNGLSERAVQTLEDYVRTWMAALQAHLKIPPYHDSPSCPLGHRARRIPSQYAHAWA